MSKKKSLYLILMFLSFIILVDTGYAKSAENKKAEPIIFRVAYISPPKDLNTKHLKKAFNDIEKFTENRIKFEVYWSQSLLKIKQILRGINKGICSIGWVGAGLYPAELPLAAVHGYILYVPKGNDSSWIAEKTWEFLDQCQEIENEFKRSGQIPWMVLPYDGYCLFSRKKPVRTIEDIKGMRIRTATEGQAKMISAIGGNPIFITSAETYTALEKGTVDGCLAGLDWGRKYNLHEVAPYITDAGLFLMPAFLNVSLVDLDKMSKNDKIIFLEVGRKESINLGKSLKEERENIKINMKNKGASIIPFPREEREKWAKTPQVKNIIKNWIEEQNSAGRPGTKVMRALLNAFEVPQWMPEGY